MDLEKVVTIKAISVKRAGATILVSFICPKCKDETLAGAGSIFCAQCGWEEKAYLIDISGAKFTNIVAIDSKVRRVQISAKMVRELYQSQEGYCAYCESFVPIALVHIDHILPISFDGSNKIDNLAVSCAKCNLYCSNKVFKSFSAKKDHAMLAAIKRGYFRLPRTSFEEQFNSSP